MAVKEMTANSTIIFDDKRGEYRQFYAGDTFDTTDEDDARLLKKMGDHLFVELEEAAPAEVDLENMKVKDLLAVANDLGLEPRSQKKADLIEAIRSYDEANAAEEGE